MPTIPMPDLLDFQESHRRHNGAKEEEIRARFGISPTLFYVQLNRVIDTREALEYKPMLVRRLRRVRDRGAAEQARRLTG